MQKQYILNKGTKKEIKTVFEGRLNYLLSFASNTLSETKEILTINDIKEKNQKAVGYVCKFSFNIKGELRHQSTYKQKQPIPAAYINSLYITKDNIDVLLSFIYENNTCISGYKTKNGAKKYILKQIKIKENAQ